ncbi:hypothetical protein AGMMS50255_7390 [Spirochaetia bacterium]|nr:hypothetical protein AGMMS50255_7390 [Spirochaetia bacterium]
MAGVRICFICYNKNMSFVSDMLAAIKNFVKNLPGKLSASIPRDLLQKLHLPEGKGKFFLVGFGALLLILIICLIVVVLGMNSIPEGTDTLSRAFQPIDFRLQIPPDELFLPDEPDFLPGVVPGREQRDSWTAEDAAPFWYNPLENGEEQWRARIESVIDELLEHVP